MTAPIRILVFSTLYPNPQQQRHGIFVEQRLRQLLSSGRVEARVVAPVPWFPFRGKLFGEYGKYARVPRRETRHGIDIAHPAYPVIPKLGMSLAPFLLAAAMRPVLRRLLASGYDFDIIDAHYYYPDGVAAILLGRWFGKPVVITARGTDINLVPQCRLPRALIRWAAGEAAASITVCQALKDAMCKLGIDGERISVLRNGVNLELFRPVAARTELRQRLGIRGRTLISVGHLIERKGHHLVIAALARLPDIELLIAGDGPEEKALRAQAREIGVAGRVRFLGALKQDELREYYAAADALVLASSREGWANVLLESMACGTPVVATSVWGTPEVVAAPEAGVLATERSAECLAAAVTKLFDDYPAREATRRYAEKFGWQPTTEGQLAIFERIRKPAS